MKRYLILLAAIIFAITLSISAWYIGRKVNYTLSYESMVRDTVREMVKEESLK